MKAHKVASVCVGALMVAGAVAAGCGSNSGNGPAGGSSSSSGSSSGSTSSSGSSSGTASSSGSSSGTASSSGSSSGGTVSDGGALALCQSGLTDKVTTCTSGTSPSCDKGCGPDLPAGSTQSNLGNKECDCSTSGVYLCQACVYESPLPGCYQPAASPPACAAGVADKGSCATPCSGAGTGNDVCTLTTDAGKIDGCVCIEGASAPVWTCQTMWW